VLYSKLRSNIFSKDEKIAWAPAVKMKVSDWADSYRVLSARTSAVSGQWKTELTPYLKEIMDSFNNPLVEEITIMASTQVGKTESIFNMLGYVIDQDPGPALLVYPKEDNAKSVSSNRIKPMIEESPQLKKHLSKSSDDFSTLEYNLDFMDVYFSGANSPADLSSKPIRYLFMDEVDKFPRFSGKEADPIKLATERTRTYWNRKIIKVSTPTTETGYIYREYQKSDQLKFYLPCPHCGEYQILVFRDQLKWPDEYDDKPDELIVKRLAWYECVHCKKRIYDQQKVVMLKNGVWAKDENSIRNNNGHNSRHRGFWINALYSPWLTFSEIAAEFLKSKKRPELLMNFVNSWLAEPWIQKAKDTQPDKIREKCFGYNEGMVPDGAIVLTAGVDVQKDHFYFVIRGWGFGEESWLIRSCRVESWNELISALFNTGYKNYRSNEIFKVRIACIDSGYRTDEVYDVCRRWGHVAIPTKGKDHMERPYKISYIDRNYQGGKMRGGLALYHLDVSQYKDKLNRLVHTQPGDPAQWHIFDNISNDYVNQLCGERKIILVDKGGRGYEEWRPVTQGAKNHYLDCEVYATAAADIISVWQLRDSDRDSIYKPEQQGNPNRKEPPWDIMTGEGKWL